jgi:hypothetical protein
MKSALVCVLLVASALCVRLDTHVGSARHVEDLKQSEWGRTLIEMMQLHAMSHGPVDELLTAIEDLLADLSTELQELEFNFGVRTNEHNAAVVRLEQDIQDAVIDTNRCDDAIENLLKPRRTQLRKKIDTL